MRFDVFPALLSSCAFALIAGCGGGPQPGPVAPAAEPLAPLENGVYFVKNEIPMMAATPPPGGKDERVLRYDPTRFDSLSREAARFVRIDAAPGAHEPLVEGEPQTEATEDGKQLLYLQLDEGRGKAFTFFRSRHEGGKVAVVVAGEVVSVHKVREMENLGHLRIAKCTEKGCDAIRSKLSTR